MINRVHIQWDGPAKLSEISKYNDEAVDYGIYQVYGTHPSYGMDVLLYIGMACQQTFSIRIKQHDYEIDEYNEGDRKYYIGRLTGPENIPQQRWEHLITISEKLLINSHTPAYNSMYIKALDDKIDKELQNLHILNWGNYARLLPEVSGDRWTNKWATDEGYEPFRVT